jgi:Amt family ammonium transporter
MKVDDPVNASQIHLFCGIWGVLAVGFFDETFGLINTGDFS